MYLCETNSTRPLGQKKLAQYHLKKIKRSVALVCLSNILMWFPKCIDYLPTSDNPTTVGKMQIQTASVVLTTSK